jgi:hypothetical protein
MKLNKKHLKALSVGLILAAASTGGHAAILSGGPNGIVASSNGNPGELFLSVLDQTGAQSFSLDLGVTYPDFVANANQTRSWDLGTLFSSFANAGHQLVFNVAGSWSAPGVGSRTAPNVQDGYVMSHKPGFQLNTSVMATADIVTNQNLIQDRVDQLNQAACGVGTPCYSDFAANISQVSQSGTQGYFDLTAWGLIGWTDYVSVRNPDGSPDEVLELFDVHVAPGSYATNKAFNGASATIAAVGGGGVLDANGKPGETTMVFRLNAATNTLTWSPLHVTAVPVPAPLWLLMSALTAMGVISRRNGGVDQTA